MANNPVVSAINEAMNRFREHLESSARDMLKNQPNASLADQAHHVQKITDMAIAAPQAQARYKNLYNLAAGMNTEHSRLKSAYDELRGNFSMLSSVCANVRVGTNGPEHSLGMEYNSKHN